jgi:HD-like signal output (HDOD) protein/CheY-like chemotaxis protein
MKHVTFVDDDPALLEGLRDALRCRRREWRMDFVGSGPEALAALEARPCDVIVSDLQMPGMDGADLLSTVAERLPDSVRIVLSGAASESTVARAAAVAHRLVAKPCETADLVRIIERACALHETADRVRLRRTAAGASELPSAPRLYSALTALLADPHASVADAAEVAAQDVGISAKVLQLANSSVFGTRRPITSVRDAIALVGLTTLRVLALSAGALIALGRGRSTHVPGFSVDALQRRSLQVATVAQLVRGRVPDADDAFSAGLLLDVGLLVFATQEREHLAELVASATAEGHPIVAVERAHGDVTHADVGAHLLALWGLPPAVVDAVAHHDDPSAIPSPAFDVAAAAHLADAIVDTLHPDPLLGNGGIEALSDAYLDALGVRDRLDGWLERAAELLGPAAGDEAPATPAAA